LDLHILYGMIVMGIEVSGTLDKFPKSTSK
jgi:hypothetical protein